MESGGPGLSTADQLSPYLFIIAIDFLQYVLNKATETACYCLYVIEQRAYGCRCMPMMRGCLLILQRQTWIWSCRSWIISVRQHVCGSTPKRVQLRQKMLPGGFISSVAEFCRRAGSFSNYVSRTATLFGSSAHGPPTTLSRQSGNRLAGWQRKLMNIGGRRELVRTILGALPTYLLTVVKPPKKFYSAMDKIRKRFLWARSQDLHGGKCKVNWLRVCQPLKYGGFGISDLEKFGQAL
jgi:hypothetical protein